MQLKDIAVSNLKVRKSKMLFLILGIVLGISTVVTLSSITLSMQHQLESNFEAQGARVLVTPESQSLSLSYNGVSVASGVSFRSPTINQEVTDQLFGFADRGVTIVAPKLVESVEINSTKALVAGVQFADELKLKPYWEITGAVPKTNELLLGAVAAGTLDLVNGDKVDILGQSFTVSGILQETGTSEDKLVFLNLPQAQQLFDKSGRITFAELSVTNTADADEEDSVPATIALLQEQFRDVQVTEVKDQTQARRDVVDRFAKFSLLVSVVVLFIGCLIVLTTMMSSVRERTREIGIFRAIGFRQSHIIKVIMTEALIISVIGGISGYVGGILLAKVAAPFIAQIEVQVGWSAGLAAAAVVISLLVGLLSSAYPAYLAARLDPVEAFRHI